MSEPIRDKEGEALRRAITPIGEENDVCECGHTRFLHAHHGLERGRFPCTDTETHAGGGYKICSCENFVLQKQQGSK